MKKYGFLRFGKGIQIKHVFFIVNLNYSTITFQMGFPLFEQLSSILGYNIFSLSQNCFLKPAI